MSQIEVTINDLPLLPFVQILSYLPLQDRLELRAVSRIWRSLIDSLKVKSLCLSSRPTELIFPKNRLANSARFAPDLINSSRFLLFFSNFHKSILSDLRHLSVFVKMIELKDITTFSRALNSLGQLEELFYSGVLHLEIKLPMLKRISLQGNSVARIEKCLMERKLTLDVPRLQKIEILAGHNQIKLDILDAGSVETLLTNCLQNTEVEKLKGLKFLYYRNLGLINLAHTHLASLEHLKEIHLSDANLVSEVFKQKQQNSLTGLKIYLCGVLLNRPDEPINSDLIDGREKILFSRWAANVSMVPNIILFCDSLYYSQIELVVPELAINILNRLTNLHSIHVDRPVQNVQRFLNFLKSFDSITELDFMGRDHPQELFDRLPEHCAVQKLTIHDEDLDLTFLLRLRGLLELSLFRSIDSEILLKILEQLNFLSYFTFTFFWSYNTIRISHPQRSATVQGDFLCWNLKANINSNRRFYHLNRTRKLPDLNAVIQHIVKNIHMYHT